MKKKTASNVSFSNGQAESGGTRIELHRVEDSPEHKKPRAKELVSERILSEHRLRWIHPFGHGCLS